MKLSCRPEDKQTNKQQTQARQTMTRCGIDNEQTKKQTNTKHKNKNKNTQSNNKEINQAIRPIHNSMKSNKTTKHTKPF